MCLAPRQKFVRIIRINRTLFLGKKVTQRNANAHMYVSRKKPAFLSGNSGFGDKGKVFFRNGTESREVFPSTHDMFSAYAKCTRVRILRDQ